MFAYILKYQLGFPIMIFHLAAAYVIIGNQWVVNHWLLICFFLPYSEGTRGQEFCSTSIPFMLIYMAHCQFIFCSTLFNAVTSTLFENKTFRWRKMLHRMWRSAATAHHRIQSLKLKLQRGSGVFTFKSCLAWRRKLLLIIFLKTGDGGNLPRIFLKYSTKYVYWANNLIKMTRFSYASFEFRLNLAHFVLN